jgi:hypothetical protein
MRYLIAAAVLLSAAGRVSAQEALVPSHSLDVPAIGVLMPVATANFDLMDVRSEDRQASRKAIDVAPHSIFGLKRHFGVAVGYDNQVLHGSFGMYITIAEVGRWNFGIPSPEIGFSRYQQYDPKRQRSVTQEEPSLFISLASVHYRLGYLRSLGMNCYINVEQIFDMRQNAPGSQIGISLSSK